jgi:phage tail-like protein
MSAITPVDRSAERYPSGWLVGQLPVGLRDDDLLVRLTTIFERVGATLRAGADGTEHVADHTVTTPGMLDFMSRWFGPGVLDPELEVTRQRQVLVALGRALPRRGTAIGLRILLEAITGDRVTVIDPGGVGREGELARHEGVVEVVVTSPGHLREHELAALVRDEVPAHLGVRLVITGRDAITVGEETYA